MRELSCDLESVIVRCNERYRCISRAQEMLKYLTFALASLLLSASAAIARCICTGRRTSLLKTHNHTGEATIANVECSRRLPTKTIRNRAFDCCAENFQIKSLFLMFFICVRRAFFFDYRLNFTRFYILVKYQVKHSV